MTALTFSNHQLQIDDLPSRPQSLDDGQSADVLGGWGFIKKTVRRFRRRARKIFRRIKRRIRRPGRRAYHLRAAASASAAARRMRAKAAFHRRMAFRF